MEVEKTHFKLSEKFLPCRGRGEWVQLGWLPSWHWLFSTPVLTWLLGHAAGSRQHRAKHQHDICLFVAKTGGKWLVWWQKGKTKSYVFIIKTLVTFNFDDNTINKAEALHKMQQMFAQFELSNRRLLTLSCMLRSTGFSTNSILVLNSGKKSMIGRDWLLAPPWGLLSCLARPGNSRGLWACIEAEILWEKPGEGRQGTPGERGGRGCCRSKESEEKCCQ